MRRALWKKELAAGGGTRLCPRLGHARETLLHRRVWGLGGCLDIGQPKGPRGPGTPAFRS